MREPKEIFVRLERCMGCHTCALACAVEHSECKTLFGALTEPITPKKRIFVEWVGPNDKVPVVCRHCEDAPCMHACISGAISRSEDGVVRTDSDKCIGCWTCVMVCPYGVIGRDPVAKKAYRCDRCPDRDVPACVASCPTKALVYATADAYSSTQRQKAAVELLAGEGS